MARYAAAAARAHHAGVPGAAEEKPESAGRDRHRRARQGARRRHGLGAARHRGGRVRLRHPASAEGRVFRERRHAGRHPYAAPAGRRLRGHHAVQLSR